VKVTMMQSTDRDRVFVTDLAAKRAWLSEANMMRLGRRAAAHNARLGGDELAVLPVAHADSFCRDATGAIFSLLQQDDWIGHETSKPPIEKRGELAQ
jgi:hypothetical protein